MPKYVKVAKASEVPEGTGRLVMGPFEKPMALFHAGGRFYAINYVCPHMGGPLGEGALRGFVVACPWHQWTFDVRTGEPDHPGGHRVAAYETKVEGDDVYVGWLKRGSEG